MPDHLLQLRTALDNHSACIGGSTLLSLVQVNAVGSGILTIWSFSVGGGMRCSYETFRRWSLVGGGMSVGAAVIVHSLVHSLLSLYSRLKVDLSAS